MCVCVFLSSGWHCSFVCSSPVTATDTTIFWSNASQSPPPSTLPPPPPSQIPSSKNPNESRNNGKELFFCLHHPIKSVSFNGVKPSTCSWFNSPTLPAMYPAYLSIKFLNSSSKQSTNPRVQPIFRQSFIRSSIRYSSSHTHKPTIHTSTEPSSDPCNHTTIRAASFCLDAHPAVLHLTPRASSQALHTIGDNSIHIV